MEIISYVKWTEPGEKQKFFNLVETSKDDSDLKEKIQQKFNVDAGTALTAIIKFREKIQNLRK